MELNQYHKRNSGIFVESKEVGFGIRKGFMEGLVFILELDIYVELKFYG